MDGAGSYSVAHRAGLLPTELTGMWGWILLRSPHRGRGSPPAPAPTKPRPDPMGNAGMHSAKARSMRYALGHNRIAFKWGPFRPSAPPPAGPTWGLGQPALLHCSGICALGTEHHTSPGAFF